MFQEKEVSLSKMNFLATLNASLSFNSQIPNQTLCGISDQRGVISGIIYLVWRSSKIDFYESIALDIL